LEPVVLNPKRHGRWGVALAALVVLLVSACGPTHIDPRWSSISVLDEDKIVLAFGDRLTLVNAIDGTPVSLLDANGSVRLDDQGNPRIWEVRGGEGGQVRFYNTPVITGDETLLAPSYDMRLLEIDVPVARVDTGGAALDQHLVSSPVLNDTLVYQGLADRDLVALRADDFTEVWRVETGHGIWSQPLLVDDTLYFSSMDHFLYAVDAQTGEVQWKTDLQGAMTSTPVYADGHLYIGSFAKKVFDVSAETGEIQAELPTADWVWSTPSFADGTLYVTDVGGNVYAFDTQDGFSQDWTVKASERSIASTPLVTESVVIVGSRDQNVYWIDRETGEVMDTKATAGEVMADPILLEPSEDNNLQEPLVVVSTTANQELLVAFTLDRGQRVWAYGR
jgi:outer membrane protein assembly factor BamB